MITSGRWTALGDTKDIQFEKDGSSIQINELQGPTKFVGDRTNT